MKLLPDVKVVAAVVAVLYFAAYFSAKFPEVPPIGATSLALTSDEIMYFASVAEQCQEQ